MAILSSPREENGISIFFLRGLKGIVFSTLLLLTLSVQAVNNPNVIINEIAWMGTANSYNDEWVELYNNTDKNINLDGWTLKTADDNLEIKLEGIVLSKDFFILERTDDTTLPNLPANLIYTGSLNNEGEDLKLYNNQEELIDFIEFSDGWPAGDNKTKQTMEKISFDNWQTSLNPGGTPGKENSAIPVQKEQSSEQLINDSSPDELKISPSGIVINEFLPSPEGADAENEWIELHNQNNTEIDLAGCQIRDVVGAVKTYAFPQNTIISPQGYLVFLRPATKITLNNSGDSLELIGLNDEILDTVTYEKAPRGQSYNKTDSDWVLSKDLSPRNNNIISVTMVESETEPQDFVSGGIGRTKEEEKRLAALAEQIPDNSFSFPAFFPALILAIFSASIILFLKRKLK